METNNQPSANQPPTQGGDNGTPPANQPPTQGGDNGTPPANQPPANQPPANQPPTQGGDKPFLGNEPPKNGNEPPAAAPDEKAYLDAIVKDENIFGKDDNIVFDQSLIKAVIPACQKYNIPPEAANAIANAFAKAQFDGAREAYKQRADYFAKMNGEARAKYTDGDFEQINRGIDKYFKPGGVMNNVIRNSELGADPEFLALMHELGAAAKEDAGKGAAAGGGSGGGDPNGIDGLSKLW